MYKSKQSFAKKGKKREYEVHKVVSCGKRTKKKSQNEIYEIVPWMLLIIHTSTIVGAESVHFLLLRLKSFTLTHTHTHVAHYDSFM